jgi:hypothetical protein
LALSADLSVRPLADSPDGCTEATLIAHGFTDEPSNG